MIKLQHNGHTFEFPNLVDVSDVINADLKQGPARAFTSKDGDSTGESCLRTRAEISRHTREIARRMCSDS